MTEYINETYRPQLEAMRDLVRSGHFFLSVLRVDDDLFTVAISAEFPDDERPDRMLIVEFDGDKLGGMGGCWGG